LTRKVLRRVDDKIGLENLLKKVVVVTVVEVEILPIDDPHDAAAALTITGRSHRHEAVVEAQMSQSLIQMQHPGDAV
jgi:hypothetical protein